MNVIIVGGGAAGLFAGIVSARNGHQVTILEHKDRIGKKILATGNGKCNYTNTVQNEECYRSDQKGFAKQVLSQFSAEQTIEFFEQLGIYPKSKNGYIYPNSEQAASVLDVLRMELNSLGVRILCDEHVEEIQKKKQTFTVRTKQQTYRCDRVIVCTGSKASENLGSDGSGYAIAKKLGHRIVPVVPALVALKAKGTFFKAISGVRVESELHLFVDQKEVIRERGELQLTNYGVSGIPVFQISRFAAKALYERRQVTLSIDFLPEIEYNELFLMVMKRKEYGKHKSVEDFLVGLLNRKLIGVLVKEAGLSPQKMVADVSKEQINRLVTMMKQFPVVIEATNPFDSAQICAGGIDTKEINPFNMESNLVKGLYFAGEIVDVDGICGGYNLQWAWSSAYVAGCLKEED